MPTLNQQILEAEQAEDTARRQFALYAAALQEARFALTAAVDRTRYLKNRRDILIELNRDDLLSRAVPAQERAIALGPSISRLQCARCHAWLDINQTEHCDCVGIVCKPCAAIVRRADEELEKACKQAAQMI